MRDLSTMTNGKLADMIERVCADRETASLAVWALADSPDERWGELVERLGDPAPHETALEYRASDPRHPVLIAYREADEAWEDVRYEARQRCGPAVGSTLYETVLRQSPRYRRNPCR